jgi:hypothetical protein
MKCMHGPTEYRIIVECVACSIIIRFTDLLILSLLHTGSTIRALMSSITSGSQAVWQTLVRQRLEERDAKEKEFDEMVENCE